MKISVNNLREDFPILKEKVYGKDLVYLDNAASTQKPKCVIDKITELYEKYNSNIHRGVHFLSDNLTDLFEKSRLNIGKFIGVDNSQEIIITKGTTDSVNLVAFSFGESFISENDEIIVSEMEHHSNMVPWQMMCLRKGVKLVKLPINDNGEISLETLKELINENTKLISIAHVSNSLGTINNIKEICKIAHNTNVKVFVDGAQAIQHINIDVKELDVDFYAFSGHKLYGPTGVGVLYGKKELLNQMSPYQYGGEMISKVSFEKTTFNSLPFKFEAGTPNFIGTIALSTAIDYINQIGIENIFQAEKELLSYATNRIKEINGIKLIGTAKNKCSVLSFIIDGIHPTDIGIILDKFGIAIRTGNHCAQPVMEHFGITGTARASFAFYNTKDEVDIFINALKKAIAMLS